MKKMVLILSALLVLCLSFGTCLAQETSEIEEVTTMDTAGNVLTTSAENIPSASRDLYWVGEDLVTDSLNIGNNAFMLGKTLTITDSEANGSYYAAGQTIAFNGIRANGNIFLAGQNISVDSESVTGGFYAVAENIGFSGECEYIAAAAKSITIDGVVHGDVSVAADSITVGSNAVIEGKLDVSGSTEPIIAEGAQVNTVNYEQSAVEETAEPAAPAKKGFDFVGLLKGVLGAVVTAALLCLLKNSALKGALEMGEHQAVKMVLFGLLALIVIPIAALILLITGIGGQAGALLLLAEIMICIAAIPFTGAVLGRLSFPQMNGWLSALIGAAVLALVTKVPYVGGILTFLAGCFAMGYFILAAFSDMNKTSVEEVLEAPVSETEVLEEN